MTQEKKEARQLKSFYSTLVRLKEQIQKALEMLADEFLFHIGTIKSYNSLIEPKILGDSFYSTLVRLKECYT